MRLDGQAQPATTRRHCPNMRHVLPYIMRGQASESGTGTLQFAVDTVSKSALSMEIVTVVSALVFRRTAANSAAALLVLGLVLPPSFSFSCSP